MLRRSGCKNEKIAFIMDESNVLDSGFLERMNTLLANGEVAFCRCVLLSFSGCHCINVSYNLCRFLASLKEMNMQP